MFQIKELHSIIVKPNQAHHAVKLTFESNKVEIIPTSSELLPPPPPDNPNYLNLKPSRSC
jgi:hypothetical protein